MTRRLGATRSMALAGALLLAVAGCGPNFPAERLSIETGGFNVAPGACPLGLAAPFRIERDESEMVFVDVASERRLSIVWPFGFAAWVDNGRAVLYASDGLLVGREGDVVDNVGGGATPEGDDILVCGIGVRTYR